MAHPWCNKSLERLAEGPGNGLPLPPLPFPLFQAGRGKAAESNKEEVTRRCHVAGRKKEARQAGDWEAGGSEKRLGTDGAFKGSTNVLHVLLLQQDYYTHITHGRTEATRESGLVGLPNKLKAEAGFKAGPS